MARKDLPLQSLKEVVTYARVNPRQITYASAGANAFREAGGKPVNPGAAVTRALSLRDVQRWTRLIREAAIRVE